MICSNECWPRAPLSWPQHVATGSHTKLSCADMTLGLRAKHIIASPQLSTGWSAPYAEVKTQAVRQARNSQIVGLLLSQRAAHRLAMACRNSPFYLSMETTTCRIEHVVSRVLKAFEASCSENVSGGRVRNVPTADTCMVMRTAMHMPHRSAMQLSRVRQDYRPCLYPMAV